MDDAWIDLGPAAELPEGQPALRKGGGRRFACVKHGERVDVLDDVCPHQGYPLSQGTLRDGVLTCQWHNWKFETSTGQCSFGGESVRRFPARIEDGRLLLLPGLDAAAETRRLEDGIRAGLFDNEPGRVVRDGLRLGALGAGAAGALAVIAGDAAARARYGFDHSLAVLADVSSWHEAGLLDGAEALSVAATSAGEEEQARPPRPRHEDAAEGSVAEHLRLERREQAEAGVRAMVRAAGAGAARDALLPFVAGHLYDYGHGAIFLAKALELAERFPAVAEEVLASATVQLSWATAETALPPFAATREALLRLEELPERREPGSGFDRAAFEAAVLAGERSAVERSVELLGAGCGARELLRAIAHAAAVRLARFDPAWQERLDAEVGVLDVTHAVTFAESALALTRSGDEVSRAAARRLAVIAAGFVGKLRAADGPEGPALPRPAGELLAAVRKRDAGAALALAAELDAPARRAAYRTLAPFAALEAAVRPIHFAHAVKTTEALRRLEEDDPEADGAYLRALLAYLVPRRPERNLRRLAAVASQFLRDGRPPGTLY